MSQKVNYFKTLDQLLISWLVCFGAITVLVDVGWLIPHKWIPVIGYALSICIVFYGRYNFNVNGNNCSLMSHYTLYTVFTSSTIMLIINVLNTDLLYGCIDFPLNREIPYIPALIVFPVSTIFFIFGLFRICKPSYCKICMQRSGYHMKNSIESAFYHTQSRYQIKLVMYLSLVLSIVVVVYHQRYYIDVNLNSPDTFFFFITPLMVYVLSSVYLFYNNINLKFQIEMEPTHFEKGMYTEVRFIIIRGNSIILEEEDVIEGIKLYDTPAKADITYTNEFLLEEATEMFTQISGVENFTIKNLFSTNTVKYNVFHYAIVLDNETTSIPGIAGDWYDLYQIDNMLRNGVVARPFAYEIHRIFTMTMAWKTYNRDGKRLYPIKNYRPTFRLADFKSWDIDYEDLEWLKVADNNEDKPMFKIKKFWRKYISGMDREWKKNR